MSEIERDLDAASFAGDEVGRRRLDQLLEWAAIGMVPLGLSAILLGWLGAAHTPFLFEQVPYLISGGLLGVGLLAAAGTAYLASWVARGAQAQRQDTARLLVALEDLRVAIAVSSGGGHNGGATTYLATPNGSMFHRPDCPIVQGRDDVHEVDIESGDLHPCGMCEPLEADAARSTTN